MAIVLRSSARVALPDEYKSEVLGMYLHYNRDGDSIKNYMYSKGYAYLPLNKRKLQYVAELLNEEIVDERTAGVLINAPFVLNESFKFREHQAVPSCQLLEFCRENKYAVMVAQCGAGKTIMLTWVAGQLGCKVLILVDMGSLQSQWQEAFKTVWGKDVQIIKKTDTNFADVCIATFQLLSMNDELVLLIREHFGTLVLDEFHSTSSECRRAILFKLNNMYRLGTTATLLKKNYSSDVLTDFVADQSVVVEDSSAMKANIEFVSTGCRWYSGNPDDWGKIISKLSKETKRNTQIAKLAIAMATAGRKVLVVGSTIECLHEVMAHFKNDPFCKPILYIGSTTLKQDLELKAKIASGEVNILATVKKCEKGADYPALDCLILAKPLNNEAGVIQIVGRIVRPVEGKPTPIVFDMVDSNELAYKMAKNRRRW